MNAKSLPPRTHSPRTLFTDVLLKQPFQKISRRTGRQIRVGSQKIQGVNSQTQIQPLDGNRVLVSILGPVALDKPCKKYVIFIAYFFELK